MGCCSSSADVPPNPERVDLSHFELMKVVGRGGFGKVNAVTRKNSQELLALKRMAKEKVCEKQCNVDMVWVERDIMRQLKGPFLVNLLHAFQDERELFLVMPFMRGGDLRYYLKTQGVMNEDTCRFYSAQTLLALEELHKLHIVYRDMKPDNLLLDENGNVRLSDFGISVQLQREYNYKTRGRAGTPGYLAPELLEGNSYGCSVDLWSFGCTIYEFMHGHSPFSMSRQNVDPGPSGRRGSRTEQMLRACSQHVTYSRSLSNEARDLLRQLLIVDPAKRGGNLTPNGISDLKAHPWFKSIDWDKLKAKSIPAPFQPDTNRANCSGDFDLEEQFLEKEPNLATAEQNAKFVGFSFNVKLKRDEDPNSPAAAGAAADGSAVPGDEQLAAELARKRAAAAAEAALKSSDDDFGESKDDHAVASAESAPVAPASAALPKLGGGPSGASKQASASSDASSAAPVAVIAASSSLSSSAAPLSPSATKGSSSVEDAKEAAGGAPAPTLATADAESATTSVPANGNAPNVTSHSQPLVVSSV